MVGPAANLNLARRTRLNLSRLFQFAGATDFGSPSRLSKDNDWTFFPWIFEFLYYTVSIHNLVTFLEANFVEIDQFVDGFFWKNVYEK